MQRLPLEQRLWAKVNKTDGCWLWTGATDGSGRYGAISAGGKVKRAHRVAYELLVGPIPDGLVIDHLCKTTLCVNPAHMELVTQTENIYRGDSLQAQNRRKTHCPQGHEYTPENTIQQKRGGRVCRACLRVHTREAMRRRRARDRAAS